MIATSFKNRYETLLSDFNKNTPQKYKDHDWEMSQEYLAELATKGSVLTTITENADFLKLADGLRNANFYGPVEKIIEFEKGNLEDEILTFVNGCRNNYPVEAVKIGFNLKRRDELVTLKCWRAIVSYAVTTNVPTPIGMYKLVTQGPDRNNLLWLVGERDDSVRIEQMISAYGIETLKENCTLEHSIDNCRVKIVKCLIDKHVNPENYPNALAFLGKRFNSVDSGSLRYHAEILRKLLDKGFNIKKLKLFSTELIDKLKTSEIVMIIENCHAFSWDDRLIWKNLTLEKFEETDVKQIVTSLIDRNDEDLMPKARCEIPMFHTWKLLEDNAFMEKLCKNRLFVNSLHPNYIYNIIIHCSDLCIKNLCDVMTSDVKALNVINLMRFDKTASYIKRYNGGRFIGEDADESDNDVRFTFTSDHPAESKRPSYWSIIYKRLDTILGSYKPSEDKIHRYELIETMFIHSYWDTLKVNKDVLPLLHSLIKSYSSKMFQDQRKVAFKAIKKTIKQRGK